MHSGRRQECILGGGRNGRGSLALNVEHWVPVHGLRSVRELVGNDLRKSDLLRIDKGSRAASHVFRYSIGNHKQYSNNLYTI